MTSPSILVTVICMMCIITSCTSSATLRVSQPNPYLTTMYRAPPSYDSSKRHQMSPKHGVIIVAKQPSLSSKYRPKLAPKPTTPTYPAFSGQWQVVTPLAPPVDTLETVVVYNEDGTRVFVENPPSTSEKPLLTTEKPPSTREIQYSSEKPWAFDVSTTPVLEVEESTTVPPTTTTTTKVPPVKKKGSGSLLGKFGGGLLTRILSNLFTSGGRQTEVTPVTSQVAMNRFGRPMEEEVAVAGWRPLPAENRGQPAYYSPPDLWVTSYPDPMSPNPMEHLRIYEQEPLQHPVDPPTGPSVDYEDYDYDDGQSTPSPQLMSWFIKAGSAIKNPLDNSKIIPDRGNTSDFTRNPSHFEERPIDFINNPSDFNKNPSGLIKNPSVVTNSTSDFAKNPYDFIENHSDTTTNPSVFMERPIDFFSIPFDFNKTPSEVSKNPFDLIKNPPVTNNPSDFTKNLSEFDKVPSDVDKTPSDFIKNPSDFIKTPSDFIKNPSDFIKNPSDFNKNPFDLTKNSSDVTKNSSDVMKYSEYIKEPSDFITNPSDPTKPPTDYTKNPFNFSKNPSDYTNASVPVETPHEDASPINESSVKTSLNNDHLYYVLKNPFDDQENPAQNAKTPFKDLFPNMLASINGSNPNNETNQYSSPSLKNPFGNTKTPNATMDTDNDSMKNPAATDSRNPIVSEPSDVTTPGLSEGVINLLNNTNPTEALWVIREKLPSEGASGDTVNSPTSHSFQGPVADHVVLQHLTKMHSDLSSHVTSLFPFLAPLSHMKAQLWPTV